MNPTNTFVLASDDCPVDQGVIPTPKADKQTLASLQYQILTSHPYRYTLDELILEVHLRRLGLSEAERAQQAPQIRDELFRKSHPCMRASPLPKTYGFGVHYDQQGRIAIYPIDSAEYQRLAHSTDLTVVKGLRNRRAA